MAEAGFPGVNLRGADPVEHGRQIALVLNRVNQGKINAVAELTLRASETTTVLEDARLAQGSFVYLDPITANAAAKLAAGTVYCLSANRLGGSWIFTHANAGTTDRTYRVLIIG